MRAPRPRAVIGVAWVVGLVLVDLATGAGVSARREVGALAAPATPAAIAGALNADLERSRPLLARLDPDGQVLRFRQAET